MAGREASATEARGGARPARRPAARSASVSEERYDLLTAALLGVAVGVTATMMLRGGRSAARMVVRPKGALAVARHGRDVLEEGLERAGRKASKLMGRGGSAISDTAEELGRYLGSAREAIDGVVADELRDLRRAIRRQRRRAGL